MLLSARLSLFDVDDVEALCAKALHDQLRAWRATLRPDDRDDALSFLVAYAWELSLKFQPERCSSFSKYLYNGCRRYGLVNWYRQRFPGSRSRFPRPEFLSLNAPQGANGDGSGLDALVSRGPGDLPGPSDPALSRLFATRDRERDRDLAIVRALAAEQAGERKRMEDKARREQQRALRYAEALARADAAFEMRQGGAAWEQIVNELGFASASGVRRALTWRAKRERLATGDRHEVTATK